jgi:hypothetical protein
MRMRTLFSHTTTLIAGIILAGLGTAASAWTGPQNTPPTCVEGQAGCDAPLNVGTGNQVKNGGLSVNALSVYGGSYVQGSLGVGVVNPAQALDVAGYINTSQGITFPTEPSSTFWMKNSSFTGGTTLFAGMGTANNSVINIIMDSDATTGIIRLGASSDPATAAITPYMVLQKGGNIGIGTPSPTQLLQVAGTIYSSSGGFKFPDGTTQTTAAPNGGGVSAVTTASCTTNSGAVIGFTCTVSCPASYYRSGCSGYSSGVTVITSAPSGTNACICSSGNNGNTCYAYCIK